MASTGAQASDPRALIAGAAMTARQKYVVALSVLLNALDGFDILSISFAAPGIASEWAVDRASLGIVLAVELIGMAIGSVVLGLLADRLGRRPVTLGCLTVMAIGMFAAASAGDLLTLAAIRLGTGFGIGGLLACVNAIVSEAVNARSKTAAIAIMSAGYPTGAVVGGTVASLIIADGSWRGIFLFGATATGIMIPLAWKLVPESIDGLMRRPEHPARLSRINAALARLGHPPLAALESRSSDQPSRARALFNGPLRAVTLTLIAAYFAHMMTFYYLLKWLPKIVADLGYSPALAGSVLVWCSVGGIVGTLGVSAIASRFPVKALAVAAMIASFLSVTLFGFGSHDLASMSILAALFGVFANAGVVGLYSAIALAYPAYLRGGGTGIVIGFGRGGAALGPTAAGLFFSMGIGLGVATLIMAAGSFVAGVLIARLKLTVDD